MTMRRGWILALMGLCVMGWAAAVSAVTVLVQDGESVQEILLEVVGDRVSGSVAYQGPVTGEDENWKSPHEYQGIPLASLLGELEPGDTVAVIAGDGWHKILPAAVIAGETPAGMPILALSRDRESGDDWDSAPVLIFLPEDELFSNEDMLASVGADRAHYFGDSPSTTGMMVKGVSYLIVNYDGGPLPQPEAAASGTEDPVDGIFVHVIRGGETTVFDMAGIEALDTLTAEGTFTTSSGADYAATYTGVPMATLIGNVPVDATIRVTASDGYSMNYEAGMFLDQSEGTWVLAYKENGLYMPNDPGYFRIVQIGENNPHFTSSLSAKMVEQIEILGAYEAYSLVVTGAVTRIFERGELEAGIGCPCHTAEVSVTSKGVTSVYSGLPLWRLIAYVDDSVFPAADEGIHYNDEDFDDDLAAGDYTITLVAEDGYEQTVLSSWIARNDLFIVAFKKNGLFLDASSNGFMRFVFDDSAVLPEGTRLRSVKFLAEIRIED